MATMHIKNKFEVSFKELISATKQKGGVPDHIDVSPQEAWDILREIHRFGRNSPFSISSCCGHQTSKQFEVASRLVNKSEPIEREEALNLINSWIRGEYQVHLNDIPIDVKPDRKAPAPTESSTSTKKWYRTPFGFLR
jgi:hypothetical protein